MNSSVPQKDNPQDEADDDDAEPTPTSIPLRPIAPDMRPSARTNAVRLPPGRLSEIHRSPDEPVEEDDAQSSPAQERSGADGRKGAKVGPDSGGRAAKIRPVASIPRPAQLADTAEAADAPARPKTHMRKSYAAAEQKRVSPIPEEGTSGSPSSMNAVMRGNTEEPMPTASTASTESQRTIRGSVPATPSGNNHLRTPSYPFPYIPGTPRSWSQNFHQPFTALSPTVSSHHATGDETPGTAGFSLMSGGSTPAANPSFMPHGEPSLGPEDPRYPTPNLYDLVLKLNTEPGLEQWWATLTDVLQEHFGAERATLVQPLDPTDIENVPWGQKTAFGMNGREEYVPSGAAFAQAAMAAQNDSLQRPEVVLREPSTDSVDDIRPQKLHPERLRPRLEARHSYAGHGREVKEVLGALNDPASRLQRPQGPQRNMTHAAGMIPTLGPDRIEPKRYPSFQGSARHSSLSEPEFSSSSGPYDTGPYAEVFSTLRSLDHEGRPLIEPRGINRVLERGKAIVITRDYGSAPSDSADSGPKSANTSGSSDSSRMDRSFGNYRNVAFASEKVDSRGYSEYEQHPPSPWAQSPAPSPAVQADEERNPFFTSDEQLLEDTFNPAVSPQDYTKYEQVEALGVDHASTVVHIPLIHPTLSQPMQSSTMTPGANTAVPGQIRRSNTMEFERKAPIAILSVLTSIVPYPNNLARILKLLGPHLATSFQIALQFAHTQTQAIAMKHRYIASGGQITQQMTLEPTSFEDIVNADFDDHPGTASEGMTSPSDYSGRSRISPSSSFVGTPGWDPATHGWTQSRSVAGTPAITGTEIVDNYFESKKRTGNRSSSTASGTASTTPGKSAKRNSGAEAFKSALEDDSKTGRHERKPSRRASGKEDKSPVTRDQSPPRIAEGAASAGLSRPTLSQLPEYYQAKQHSLLHSYGANFASTFGVPSSGITPGGSRNAGPLPHARKGSYPEDMPPPSERLLRTIIDSVPVQIFTAQPDSGSLTWVNSKFLIYRGQEASQVLHDPWAAIHPDERREFLEAWNRSLRTNQQLQQKVRLERFDKSYRWFYVRAAPLKDRRQKVVHWIGTMMDFHEQQIAEMNAARQLETAESERKYRALANSSPQIVFAVSKSKGVTFCNSQWLHYSGQSEAEALVDGFMQYVHPDDLVKCRLPTFDGDSTRPTNVPTSLPSEPRRTMSNSATSSDSSGTERPGSAPMSPISQLPQRKLSELATTGILRVSYDTEGRPSYSTEVRLKSKDGNYRWHLVRILLAEPLLKHEDSEETWYGTCTDIDDHKALERDLKRAMDEKTRFLSNMSHEIRTPLNGITGMVNFLIDSSLTAEQMEHVNIIRASTEGLRGLINDILDLSKAEAGMIQLNVDWLYVRALIEEVNDLTSAMAIDKGLELNYIVQENVPAQIKGDRFRIRQILLNIVGNAIKFTQTGEVFIRCSIQQDEAGQLRKDEMLIKFDVIDTGRGFTEKEAEYLFKRFSQIDGSSTRQHGGTGLGLVISKQLAQLHGGEMSARGVPEKGSTFTFYIKATLPSEHDRPPVSVHTPGPGIPILPGTPNDGSILTTSAFAQVSAQNSPLRAATSPIAAKFASEVTVTPPHFGPADSPSVSSASSDPSVRSAARSDSLRSTRSSASSMVPDIPMTLQMPPTDLKSRTNSASSRSIDAAILTKPDLLLKLPTGPLSPPPMFSILVVAPLKYSREATVHHIDKTLPSNVPHQITARESFAGCQSLLGGDERVLFTHIVVVLRDVDEIVALMDQVYQTPGSTTAIVLITDLAQRRTIVERAPHHDFVQLVEERKLRVVFKPLKPSRFGIIFDPRQEREMSLDRNQDSAQQVAVHQKHLFEELARRIGSQGKRVLLVEDNKINQMVILKFLAKVNIKVDTALDGVQCTDKVFAQPHGHYSIILCDLHMPNKDGYQTCKEIRRWEKKEGHPYLPIIALSANVLGDVYQKCVDAGFNSYMTKPVDFKDLSSMLLTFMDPSDPKRPHELMKKQRQK